MMPKCTSWSGHKFEARYSYSGLLGDIKFTAVNGEGIRLANAIELNRSVQKTTYERDICVRCGMVVEKKP